MNSLNQIKTQTDVLIIGGGIVGAGIFRDLAKHGVDVLLVDAKDFSSQTSRSSSKMLHGGIRYLETMDFELVYEALHEKNLWLQLAPHLCYESPFHLPIYNNSLRPKWMVHTGLILYDLLSSGLNSPHQMLSPKQAIEKNLFLRQDGLKAVGVYHDAVVDDYKLTLEVIFDGNLESNAQAINHTALTKIQSNNFGHQATLVDQVSHQEIQVKAKQIIFATGPFTDILLRQLDNFIWNEKLIPSKGSHLWIRADKLKTQWPVVLTPQDGRVIFVIPQGHRVLVGTTEEKVEGSFFDLRPSAKEIRYLLDNINEFFPTQNISENDIIGSFSGVRPLVREEGQAHLGKTARNHMHYMPKENVHVIIGGKYTTFRVMASEICENVCNQLGVSYNSLLCQQALRQRSLVLPFVNHTPLPTDREYAIRHELARTESDIQARLKSDS